MKLTCDENSRPPFFGGIHVVDFDGELTLVLQVQGLWTNAENDEDISVGRVFIHGDALTVLHALLAQQCAGKFTCSGGKPVWTSLDSVFLNVHTLVRKVRKDETN